MGASHDLGRRGELLASRHLERKGWAILDRNYRIGHKEVDLVARRAGLVAFVEVKTRAGPRFGHPLEAVTHAKRREIEHVARAWIARHGRDGERYRLDVVAVLWPVGRRPVLDHVEDAWRLGE